MPRVLPALLLGLALAVNPSPITADENAGSPQESEAEGSETPAAPATEIGPEGAGSEEACPHPVRILWRSQERDGTGQLGLAVTDSETGQQVPRLEASQISVQVDEAPPLPAEALQLKQTRSVLERLPPSEQELREALSTDPVSYDVFFSVDLSRSMAEKLPHEDNSDLTKRELAVSLIDRMIKESGQNRSPVFDSDDRIFLAGFDSSPKTDLMSGLTPDRVEVRSVLSALLEHTPQSENTALFASLDNTLKIVTGLAPSYLDESARREAVIVLFTHSFNGRNLEGRSSLNRCRQNEPLLSELVERIERVREATGNRLRIYILALGAEGPATGYSLDEAPGRRCRISAAQRKTVDGRSFRALTDPKLVTGGYTAQASGLQLLRFLKEDFELRSTPYELSYRLPAGSQRGRTLTLGVTRDGVTCSASLRSASDIVPAIAAQSELETSSGELALFLTCLLIVCLFVPRSLTNLVGVLKSKSKKKRR
ncbi:MAG: vWA domain-containing protein [Myxococcota bacterium]|nr:vWA domain-containing protein [Myxococcota bacterium]